MNEFLGIVILLKIAPAHIKALGLGEKELEKVQGRTIQEYTADMQISLKWIGVGWK